MGEDELEINLEDDRGRTPVLLDPAVSVHVGETVLVVDKEGNRCKAVVAEIATREENGKPQSIAFVVPKPGTWEQTS